MTDRASSFGSQNHPVFGLYFLFFSIFWIQPDDHGGNCGFPQFSGITPDRVKTEI
jgi:hypothetical protein